jgi:hypothetical protein
MKSLTKQQLADYAGVSTRTLMNWCKPYERELEAMGLQPNSKVFPPKAVKFLIKKLSIDIE